MAPLSTCASVAAGGAWLVTSICSTAVGLGGAGGKAADGGVPSGLFALLSPECPGSPSARGATATSNVPLLAVIGGDPPAGSPSVGGGPLPFCCPAWPGNEAGGPRSASAFAPTSSLSFW
jgi:hypothetical protein